MLILMFLWPDNSFQLPTQETLNRSNQVTFDYYICGQDIWVTLGLNTEIIILKLSLHRVQKKFLH